MNYYDRITSLLLEGSKVKPEVLARVRQIQARRRLPARIPSDGLPRPGSGEPLPDTYAEVGSGQSNASVNDPGMNSPNPTSTTRRKFKR